MTRCQHRQVIAANDLRFFEQFRAKARKHEDLLRKALVVLTPEQLWVKPDCGLKTRRWEEVIPALENMVQASHRLRQTLGSGTETMARR